MKREATNRSPSVPSAALHCAALLVAAALLVPTALAAQDTDSTNEARDSDEPGDTSPETPPENPTFYETATVRERPLATATAAVSVISRREIERSGARKVAELLSLVPGVGVVTAGTRGGLTTAQIRGGDPNFTLVLIDGVPVNDPTYQVGGVFNLEAMPTAAVERIEVVRGPLSSVYGSTGLAGAIHIVTRGGGDGPRAEVELAGDEHGTGLSASAGGGAAGTRWRLGAVAEEEDERIADERFELAQLQGRFNVDLRSGAELRVAGRAAAWDASDYPDASGGPLFGDGALREADHTETSLHAELRSGRQRVEAALYRHDFDRLSPAIGQQVPAAEESIRYTRGNFGWSLADGWSRGATQWSWSVGLGVEREEARNESVLHLPPVFGGFEVPGDYDDDRTSAGAFGELSVERGDLAAELGLRLDEPDGAPGQANPRIGISYRPGGGATRLRASAGRAFKLPSFFALSSPPALGGNPELRPEVMEGVDAAVERSFAGGRARVELGLFSTRYRDLVDFDFQTFSHVNRSRVHARGAELSLDWRPTADLRLHAGLTRQNVEDEATGEPLRQRPDWRGALHLHWRVTPRLDLRLEGRHVGDFRDEQIPVPERTTVASHEVWTIAATWRLDERWRLRARADNVLDDDYESLIGFPGAGRSVRLGVRYRLPGS